MDRSNKYERVIKPRISEIQEWVKDGATQSMVADKLGISLKLVEHYLREEPEFRLAYDEAKIKVVDDLKGSLYRMAMGYTYQEVEEVKSNTGNKRIVRTKYALPSESAAQKLLLNLRVGWSNDPENLEIKRQELEIKKKMSEKEDW